MQNKGFFPFLYLSTTTELTGGWFIQEIEHRCWYFCPVLPGKLRNDSFHERLSKVHYRAGSWESTEGFRSFGAKLSSQVSTQLFGDCACAAQHGAPPCPAGGDLAGFLNARGGLPLVVNASSGLFLKNNEPRWLTHSPAWKEQTYVVVNVWFAESTFKKNQPTLLLCLLRRHFFFLRHQV